MLHAPNFLLLRDRQEAKDVSQVFEAIPFLVLDVIKKCRNGFLHLL
jgi:hypothetical protein